MDETWQNVITALTSMLGGGFAYKGASAAHAALRQRRRALGMSETRLDRALRSRYMWRDFSYRVLALLHKHAPDVAAPPHGDDPWTPADDDEMTK